MEQESADTVRRHEETLDVIITADRSVTDYLFPDKYSICGSTSSGLFLDESCNERPLENLGNAFGESYDTLFHSHHYPFATPVDYPDRLCQMGIPDVNYSVMAEPADKDSSLIHSQTPLPGIVYERYCSPFVEWKPDNVDFQQPKKKQCLLKRCIRLLKDIDSHKIVRPLAQTHAMDSTGCSGLRSKYDKLAIHHVLAERKRREQMNEIFSALRALIPVSPKKGRATLLLHTKEYVIYLKRRIEELEQRNRELEQSLSAKAADRRDQFDLIPESRNIH